MTRLTGLLVVLFGLTAAHAATEPSPRAVVDQTVTAAIAVLQDKSLSTAEKRTRLEHIVLEHVDFDVLARLVLAQSWNRFNDPQRTRFMAEFKRHLSLTYGNRIEDYRDEHVEIIGERDEVRGDHTVRTKIVRDGPNDIDVDYRLRSRDGTWRIIDFVIEGVSLVANYRAQFQEVLDNGGPDRLIQQLQEKNAHAQPLGDGRRTSGDVRGRTRATTALTATARRGKLVA
jgi:phospholipid transport system substrate-binding protein